MYLVPELANEMGTRAGTEVQAAVKEYNDVEPYWFVSKFDQTYGEGVYQPLYDYNALFLAKAYILEEPYDELVKFLDVPAFYRGDLFYIQNLVAALKAGGNPNLPSGNRQIHPSMAEQWTFHRLPASMSANIWFCAKVLAWLLGVILRA